MTRPIPYDRETARRVIHAVYDGRRIADIGRDPAFPSIYTLQKWRRENRLFDANLRRATTSAMSDHRRAKSPYGQHTRDQIVELVREGYAIDQIVLAPGMPDRSTVFYWMRSEPPFAWSMACAREEWMDNLGDRVAPLLQGLTPENARERMAARAGLLPLTRAPKVYGVDLILRDRPQDLWPLRKAYRNLLRRHRARERRWAKKVADAHAELLAKLVAEHGAEAVSVVRAVKAKLPG